MKRKLLKRDRCSAQELYSFVRPKHWGARCRNCGFDKPAGFAEVEMSSVLRPCLHWTPNSSGGCRVGIYLVEAGDASRAHTLPLGMEIVEGRNEDDPVAVGTSLCGIVSMMRERYPRIVPPADCSKLSWAMANEQNMLMGSTETVRLVLSREDDYFMGLKIVTPYGFNAQEHVPVYINPSKNNVGLFIPAIQSTSQPAPV